MWHSAGAKPARGAAEHDIQLDIVKRPKAKKDFVLLSCLWGGERSFAPVARLRCLARDYERLLETLAGFQVIAFCHTHAQTIRRNSKPMHNTLREGQRTETTAPGGLKTTPRARAARGEASIAIEPHRYQSQPSTIGRQERS